MWILASYDYQKARNGLPQENNERHAYCRLGICCSYFQRSRGNTKFFLARYRRTRASRLSNLVGYLIGMFSPTHRFCCCRTTASKSRNQQLSTSLAKEPTSKTSYSSSLRNYQEEQVYKGYHCKQLQDISILTNTSSLLVEASMWQYFQVLEYTYLARISNSMNTVRLRSD
ncbi:hypothetical protein BDZ45DRAFT_18844 [Acephala macrosclerotiorum]|nr:hypothetical protein BDZ45DRAFT_18844 [Acephala macrosclerotiorum]